MQLTNSARIPLFVRSLPRRCAGAMLLFALGLGGCKADGESRAATSAPGEDSAPQPAPREPAPVPAEPAERAEPEELMQDHFAIASQARDAVVRGRLEQAEAPLVWLGQHAAPSGMPASWRPGVERMQRAARGASSANSLAAAGQAIGSIAAECGACHAALHDGPAFEPSDWNELQTPSPRAALRERMQAQLWAIERMWEGLVGPWDGAWREGCAALGEPTGHPRVPAAQQARLEHVRALGAAAAAVTTGPERARAYGELLAECGSCHASSGIDPGAR